MTTPGVVRLLQQRQCRWLQHVEAEQLIVRRVRANDGINGSAYSGGPVTWNVAIAVTPLRSLASAPEVEAKRDPYRCLPS